MRFRSVISILAFLLLTFLFAPQAVGNITVSPVGVAVSLENEDPLEVELTLTNHGDSEVAFSIDFDEPEEDERGIGPRRDQPEGTFAMPS